MRSGGTWKTLPAAACASAVIALATADAHGQTPPHGDKVAAEALFEDGRKLVTAGQYAAACPKFADSEQLDPSPATMLNLANCWEKAGRAATAWVTYREAASMANAAGRSDYVATAERRAEALAAHLAHVTVNVAQPVAGIEVRRDDDIVPPAEWATPIPIDSGSHALSATAPGHLRWASTVDVPADGAAVTVTVPALEAAAPFASAPAVAPAGATATATESSTARPPSTVQSAAPRSSGSTQRMSGWVIGSAGIASVAVGAVFAGLAEANYKSSLGDCGPPNLCGTTGLSQRNQALSDGDVATWTIGIGAAAIAGGLALLLTAPREGGAGAKGASVAIAPTAGGAVLTGSW